MILSERAFNELLPPLLHNTSKNRIREALSQFYQEGTIDYSGFYTTKTSDFLMQSDVISSVKGLKWSEDLESVDWVYNPAMLISNSCDVTTENIRSLNQKDALFAPIIPLEEYLKDCENEGYGNEQINNFLQALKKQEFTNLFYLPPDPKKGREFFVRLDRIYWVPLSQLKETIQTLDISRFASLSQWGWYLFLVKLSLHTCRTPEEIERTE